MENRLREDHLLREVQLENAIFFAIFPCFFLDRLKCLEMW